MKKLAQLILILTVATFTDAATKTSNRLIIAEDHRLQQIMVASDGSIRRIFASP